MMTYSFYHVLSAISSFFMSTFSGLHIPTFFAINIFELLAFLIAYMESGEATQSTVKKWICVIVGITVALFALSWSWRYFVGEEVEAPNEAYYIFAHVDEDGQANGYGIQFDADKNLIYQGNFRNGQYHGEGTRSWPQKGNRQRAYGTEYGTLIFIIGNDMKQYVGEFKNGKFHGNGILDYFDGAQYSGRFENGRKEGYGTYRNSQGDTYSGTFSYMELPPLQQDRETYEGDCLMNFDTPVRCGRGSVSFAKGDKYVGEFANDNKNGLGVYYYNDPAYPDLIGTFECRLYYESKKLWAFHP